MLTFRTLNENTHPLFPALSQYNHNAALPLTPGAAHTLYEAGGIFLRVEAHDEVNLADIQSFLPYAGGHERVEATLTEPVHHLLKRNHQHSVLLSHKF